jgi:hypothetical protein
MANLTLCSGSSTGLISFSGAFNGTVYNWTNDNTSIGLAANGSGDIASFAAINNGTTAVTATITVTPSYTNVTTCSGSSTTFTITVYPLATLSNLQTTSVCDGSNATITLNGLLANSISDITYQINGGPTQTLTGIISDASGTASFTIPVTFANNGQTLTITSVSSSINNGPSCLQTFNLSTTLNVNPRPTAVISGSQTIGCTGGATLSVNYLGTGPWTFTYSTDNCATTTTVTTSSNPYTFNVSPMITTSYKICSLNDSYCPAIPSDYSDSVVTVTVDCVILPVTITNSKAWQDGAVVRVGWTSQQEINIDHYELERALDAQHFTSLGIVVAKNSGLSSDYLMTDNYPVAGNNYYRIKIVDKSGNITYTSTMVVNIGKGIARIFLYPNPALKHIFNLQMNNVNAGKYKLMVYDAAGRVVISRDVEHFEGSSTEQIFLPASTASGAYRVVLLSNEKSIFSTTLIVAD